MEVALLGLLSAKASDREMVRFEYAAYSGQATRGKVEPYHLVNLGQRWYLVAFDTDKDDWRTFRVDRMSATTGIGHRFKPRQLPDDDLAGYVADRTRQVRLRTRATITIEAPADEVAARMGPWIVGAVETLGPTRSRISLGGRDVETMARWLALLGSDFEVHDSPELSEALGALSDRFARGAG